MGLKFDYQKNIYNMLKNNTCRPRRSWEKDTTYKYIIIQVLINRFYNFNREKFETTERNFYNYVKNNLDIFICSKKEYDIAVQEFLQKGGIYGKFE